MELKMPYRWCMRVRILITPKYSKEKKIFCSAEGFGSLSLSPPPLPPFRLIVHFMHFAFDATPLGLSNI